MPALTCGAPRGCFEVVGGEAQEDQDAANGFGAATCVAGTQRQEQSSAAVTPL